MKFLSPLDTRKYVKPGEFVLLAKFKVDFEIGDRAYRVIIPRGFITDFASVPKLVQLLPGFDVNGDSANAAVLHDYLYCCQGHIIARDLASGEPVLLRLTRDQCDALFFEGLIESKYSDAAASVFYAGVRTGGWWYWGIRESGIHHLYDFVPDSYFES